MFATLFHVVLFVAAIIGLLAIKQRRLRHFPTRRTHIPRRSAEGTIWLQRAVNATLDMLHCALAEQHKGDGGPVSAAAANTNANASGAAASGPTPTTRPSAAAAAAAAAAAGKAPSTHDDDSGSDGSAEVLSDLPFLNTLKAQLEEQISALLEDNGITSFADFRIKDWGGKPPLVKAVWLSHGGGAGPSSSLSTSNSGNTNGMSSVTGSGGGLGGSPNSNVNGDGPLAGQRGSGGGVVQSMASGSSAAGSPSALGPQHYPSLSGNQPLHSSVVGRGAQLGLTTVFTSNSSNGDDAGGLTSVGGGGGVREHSLAGSMLHASRLGGLNSNSNGSGSATNLAMSAADSSAGVGGGGGSGGGATAAGTTSAAAASLTTGRNASDTTRSLSTLEAEVEVEYSGNFSVSLNADVPIARGRYLQVYASISDVRVFAAHVRLRLSLEYEPATVESPQPQPYLLGTLWLVSDPVFDVAFHSTLSQYRVRDFFLVPKLIKFFLLRFLRNKLRPTTSPPPPSSSPSTNAAARHANARRRRQGAAGAAGGGGQGTPDEAAAEGDRASSDASGLSFRIQLPADVVDGGEQWWSSMAHDTMSERPAPFMRAYHP